MIGVIGGMGPLATADFLNKLIAATPAEHDDQHVPLLISCDARIPGRPAAILDGGASPLPRLRDIRDRLIAAGATALVMPCNTAHHWYADLTSDCRLPFPSIIDASCDEALARAGSGGRVAVLATRATLAARLYEPALQARGLRPLWPSDGLLDQLILPSIAHVKAGRVAQAAPMMADAVQALRDAGADLVILACTEAPVAMAATAHEVQAVCVDSTLALARVTVALWRGGAL